MNKNKDEELVEYLNKELRVSGKRTRIYKKGFHKAVYEVFQRIRDEGIKNEIKTILYGIVGNNLVVDYFIREPPDFYYEGNIVEQRHPVCPLGYCADGNGGGVECPSEWTTPISN